MDNVWEDLNKLNIQSEVGVDFDDFGIYYEPDEPPVSALESEKKSGGDAETEDAKTSIDLSGAAEAALQRASEGATTQKSGLRGGSESDLGIVKEEVEGLRGGSQGSLGEGDAEVTEQHRIADAAREAQSRATPAVDTYNGAQDLINRQRGTVQHDMYARADEATRRIEDEYGLMGLSATAMNELA